MHRFLIDAIFACLGILICITAFWAHQEGYLSDTVSRIGFGIRYGELFPTIQGVSWVVFFIGLGELIQRSVAMKREQRALSSSLLPAGHGRVFRRGDLGQIYRSADRMSKDLIFPKTVKRIVSSFQISGSVVQSSSVLQTSIESINNEVELRYSFLKYLLWLLPSLGFIGTVWGIGRGLNVISERPPTIENATSVMREVTGELSVAFDTTLVALLLTSVLAYLIYLTMTDEEKLVNMASERCMDDLVNQLLEDNQTPRTDEAMQ